MRTRALPSVKGTLSTSTASNSSFSFSTPNQSTTTARHVQGQRTTVGKLSGDSHRQHSPGNGCGGGLTTPQGPSKVPSLPQPPNSAPVASGSDRRMSSKFIQGISSNSRADAGGSLEVPISARTSGMNKRNSRMALESMQNEPVQRLLHLQEQPRSGRRAMAENGPITHSNNRSTHNKDKLDPLTSTHHSSPPRDLQRKFSSSSNGTSLGGTTNSSVVSGANGKKVVPTRRKKSVKCPASSSPVKPSPPSPLSTASEERLIGAEEESTSLMGSPPPPHVLSPAEQAHALKKQTAAELQRLQQQIQHLQEQQWETSSNSISAGRSPSPFSDGTINLCGGAASPTVVIADPVDTFVASPHRPSISPAKSSTTCKTGNPHPLTSTLNAASPRTPATSPEIQRPLPSLKRANKNEGVNSEGEAYLKSPVHRTTYAMEVYTKKTFDATVGLVQWCERYVLHHRENRNGSFAEFVEAEAEPETEQHPHWQSTEKDGVLVSASPLLAATSSEGGSEGPFRSTNHRSSRAHVHFPEGGLVNAAEDGGDESAKHFQRLSDQESHLCKEATGSSDKDGSSEDTSVPLKGQRSSTANASSGIGGGWLRLSSNPTAKQVPYFRKNAAFGRVNSPVASRSTSPISPGQQTQQRSSSNSFGSPCGSQRQAPPRPSSSTPFRDPERVIAFTPAALQQLRMIVQAGADVNFHPVVVSSRSASPLASSPPSLSHNATTMGGVAHSSTTGDISEGSELKEDQKKYTASDIITELPSGCSVLHFLIQRSAVAALEVVLAHSPRPVDFMFRGPPRAAPLHFAVCEYSFLSDTTAEKIFALLMKRLVAHEAKPTQSVVNVHSTGSHSSLEAVQPPPPQPVSRAGQCSSSSPRLQRAVSVASPRGLNRSIRRLKKKKPSISSSEEATAKGTLAEPEASDVPEEEELVTATTEAKPPRAVVDPVDWSEKVAGCDFITWAASYQRLSLFWPYLKNVAPFRFAAGQPPIPISSGVWQWDWERLGEREQRRFSVADDLIRANRSTGQLIKKGQNADWKLKVRDVQYYVKEGANVCFRSPYMQRCILHEFIMRADLEAVRVCLAFEGNLDFNRTEDAETGNTVLHCLACDVSIRTALATDVLRMVVTRLESHPLDKINWAKKNRAGDDILSLAADADRLSVVWGIVRRLPFFVFAKKPIQLTRAVSKLDWGRLSEMHRVQFALMAGFKPESQASKNPTKVMKKSQE